MRDEARKLLDRLDEVLANGHVRAAIASEFGDFHPTALRADAARLREALKTPATETGGEDDAPDPCEGCGRPSTRRDIEDVPLCDGCYEAAPHAATCGCETCRDSNLPEHRACRPAAPAPGGRDR